MDEEERRLEVGMAHRFPGFTWTSTHGSGDKVQYTLRSKAGWLVVDRDLMVLTERSNAEVERSASVLDAMETED